MLVHPGCCLDTHILSYNEQGKTYYATFPRRCKSWKCQSCASIKAQELKEALEYYVANKQMYFYITITTKDNKRLPQLKEAFSYSIEAMQRAHSRTEQAKRGKQAPTYQELLDNQIEAELFKLRRTQAQIYLCSNKGINYKKLKKDKEKYRQFKEEHNEQIEQLLTHVTVIQKAERLRHKIIKKWQIASQFFGSERFFLGVRENAHEDSKNPQGAHFHILSNIPVTEEVLSQYMKRYTNNEDYVCDLRFLFYNQKTHKIELNNKKVEENVRKYSIKYSIKEIQAGNFNDDYIFKSRKIQISHKGKQQKRRHFKHVKTLFGVRSLHYHEAFNSIKEAENWTKSQNTKFNNHFFLEQKIAKIRALKDEELNSALEQALEERQHQYNKVQQTFPTIEKHARPDQIEALKKIRENRLSLIIGKGGTGKTELLKWLNISLQLSHTGTTCENLRKRTSFETETIAKFLQLLPFQENTPTRLSLDKIYSTIAIDEVFTIPARYILYLLLYLPKESRIIFLGDKYQNHSKPLIYRTLLKTLKDSTAELTEQKRFVSFRIEPNDTFEIEEGSTEIIKTFYENRTEHKMILANTVALKNEINRLCESTKGYTYGNYKYSRGDPVILTKNDSLRGTYNGETHIVYRIDETQIHLLNDRTGKIHSYNPLESHKFELAYCLTIQKAQSNQWDRGIVFLANTHSEHTLNMHLLYLARSRFRKSPPELYSFEQPHIINRITQKLYKNSFCYLKRGKQNIKEL